MIVPSLAQQTCLPDFNRWAFLPQGMRLPALAFCICFVILYINFPMLKLTINHRFNIPTASLARDPRLFAPPFFTYIQNTAAPPPSRHQQGIHNALPRLGCNPLSKGLPGTLQGIQDDLLRRASWQWQRVRRRQWYVPLSDAFTKLVWASMSFIHCR